MKKLKGKLLKVLLVLCLCFVPAFGVSAADSDTSISSSPNSYKVDSSIDSKGRVIMSSFRTFAVGSNNMSQTTGYIECDEDACVYGVRSSKTDKYRITLYSSGGNAYVYITESIIFDESGSSTHINTFNPAYLQSTVDYSGVAVGGVGSTSMYDHGEFATRLFIGIPIFNSNDDNFKENVQKYLDSGDVSGAENEYDISQPDQDDSVELPKNVRTYGSLFQSKTTMGDNKVQYNSMTVRWDPPSDIKNYSYDVKIQCTYSQCVVGSMKLDRVPDLTKSYSTAAKIIVQDYPYETNDRYDINTGKLLERDGSIPEDVVLNRESLEKLQFDCDFEYVFPTQVRIWVRNRLGNKCSNWVAVSSKANNVNGSDSTARVEDDNGNKVDDDNYNDTPIDNSDKHTYYDTDPDTSSAESPKFSLKEFYSYLKSGFGLLGNNGLIAFFAKSFSFIPSNIWSLITGGVAVMIVVGIINFALKR